MEQLIVASVVAIFTVVILIGAVRTYIEADKWFSKPVKK